MSLMLIIFAVLALAAVLAGSRRAGDPVTLAAAGTTAALGLLVVAAAMGRAGSGLFLLVGALTLGIGAIVLGFAQRYLRADGARTRFAVNVLVLLAAVLLLTGTQSVLSLIAGWLVSGWVLADLIGHQRHWAEARAARRRALRLFTVGDAALVAGLVLLAWQAGSRDVAVIAERAAATPTALNTLGAVLLVVAAAARCALPPFSRWLTRSMTAPTPVSALMHAGFVNAGGVLLIRFGPVLESAPAAQWLVIGAGVFAALWGTGIMLVRPDVKRALAGSTVAQMGFMLMTCGLGAYAAALWHIVAHGLFKAWLFLASGSAIGRRADAAVAAPTLGATAVAVVLSAAAGALTIAAGLPPTGALPVALAVAAALAAAPALLRTPALLAATLVLAVTYAGGVTLAGALLARPYGEAPAGLWLVVGLWAVFNLAWLAQTARRRAGGLLPSAVYVRLLNS
ncbi:hypothetical protein EYB45_08620 [Erythrobacteraceae bacterium CFH 75059]|uniref:proton-conducting transporter transmembrane domain-containing protein n=1 Tax=Qipengyuania thermophila TaxID=2509361 RepID=UPI0010218D9A|nr:proton-conducting transporter membrane subunit [Qipengyuania thermophila]TCD04297.1 hypothetical protein EYB45_08620 [Erythrobacteraceae bacterium CFH 75059]